MIYLLGLLAEMCRERKIRLRHVHLDLSTARPCFRALNDLACLLNASKRYSKGIALEDLMLRIESSLAKYTGYLVVFVDEVDNVRRDRDTFLAFLVRRLPQRIPGKLIVFEVIADCFRNLPGHLRACLSAPSVTGLVIVTFQKSEQPEILAYLEDSVPELISDPRVRFDFIAVYLKEFLG